MNKKFMAIGTVVLLSSLLFACGNGDEKQKAEDIPSSVSEKAGDASKGDTKTSSFNPSGSKKPDSEPTAEPDQKLSSPSQNSLIGSSSNSNMPDSAVQSELDDAASFADSGMIDDAREMLGYIDRDGLSDEQKSQYDRIVDMLNDEGNSDDAPSFTPQDALDIIEREYGVSFEGDTSGIRTQTDVNGREYYRLQIEIQSENVRKTVDVYQNGDITEISSEPLAFG